MTVDSNNRKHVEAGVRGAGRFDFERAEEPSLLTPIPAPDHLENARIELPLATSGLEPGTGARAANPAIAYTEISVTSPILLKMAKAAIPYDGDRFVAAESPVLYEDGRIGALVTLTADDDDDPLEESTHPNFAEVYAPEDAYEHYLMYTARGLSRVYIAFDDTRAGRLWAWEP